MITDYLKISNFQSKIFSLDALKKGSQKRKELEDMLSTEEMLVIPNAGSLTGEPLSEEQLSEIVEISKKF